MISHYANRYGIAEIELWYFELWKDPRLLKNMITRIILRHLKPVMTL